MKKVLVTGAKGQLGLSIQDVHKAYPFLDFHFKSSKDLDITDENKIDVLFKEEKFDYCINCAAYTNVEQAEKTPEIAFKVNAEAVKYLTKSCKEYGTILIHISTDYVFDGEKNSPYTEKDAPNPINVYGKSKLLGEQYIQQQLNQFFIVRTSWLYSKKYKKNFYHTILKLSKEKKEITVTTEQKGCPTNTKSLTKYLINLIVKESQFYGIKHFSDSAIMTWYDFANQILLEHNLKNKVSVVKTKKAVTFARRPKYSVLANSEI